MSAYLIDANFIMRSRMRESRTYGSVRGLRCKALVYSTVEQIKKLNTNTYQSSLNSLADFLCPKEADRYELLRQSHLVKDKNSKKRSQL
mgnify:CR=1 FL=1